MSQGRQTSGQAGGISLELMYGLIGFRSGPGPIAARKLTGDAPRPPKGAIAYDYLIATAGIMVPAPLLSLPLLLLSSLVRSIGSGIICIFSTHLLIQTAPNKVRSRALDNVFCERLWRSVKYEYIGFNQYDTVPQLKTGLTQYFDFYNHDRPHKSLNYRTPAEEHFVL